MTEQPYPRQTRDPGRSGPPRVWQEPSRSGWQMIDPFDNADTDSSAPSWAVPGGIDPVRAPRRPRQPPGRDDAGPAIAQPQARTDLDEQPRGSRRAGKTRAAAARRRRSKRRLVTWGGITAVVAVVAVSGYLLTRSPAPKSRYVNGWQKGDVRLVPDTCRAVSGTVLKQYLGGTPHNVQPYSYPAQSQCTFTVDAKPVFRVLNLTAQAYSPNLTVPGNGSATATAIYNFARQRTLLAKPPKRTPAPAATITSVSGLGVQAFSAVQVFHLPGQTDRVTVVARYRNVLMTVYMSAQTSDGFGPVSLTDLRARAIAVTRTLLGQVKQEPGVS